MQIGFIGSGNMARSIALGLDRPAVFSDGGSGKAQKLAELVGGSAATTVELANQCDLIWLCHKPKQLGDVAAEIGDYDGVVVSVLAATPLESLRKAYPGAQVARTMPNIPVELGEGVVAVAEESDAIPALDELISGLGLVERVPERDFELVTAIGGCAPAFFGLFVRDLCDAAVARGLDRRGALEIINQTMRGTSAILAANGLDPDALMDSVASPGGLTERALASFDDSGLAATVEKAVATVLGE